MNTFSYLVPLLPHLEQQPLYDAFNFSLNQSMPQNTTIAGVNIGMIQCPSDPDAAIPVSTDSFFGGTVYTTQHNSYVCNGGTWYIRAFDSARLAQQNGVFLRFMSTRLADISDGTSQTIGLGERRPGRLSAARSLVVRLVDQRLLRRYGLHLALPNVRHPPDHGRVSGWPGQ